MAGRHALHDPRAIQIDGLDADAQLLGDFAVGITLHQRQQYIALAWRELLQPRLYPRRPFTEALAMIGLAQGLQDTVQQQLFVVGFLDKVMRPGLERADHNRHIGVAADENHRQVQITAAHVLLNIQAAHARHAYIQQHTGVEAAVAGVEKLAATGKRQRLEAHRLQQPDGRVEHPLVVIHHIHHLFRHAHHRLIPLLIVERRSARAWASGSTFAARPASVRPATRHRSLR